MSTTTALATTPVPAVPVLKDIIWERYIKALGIKRRLHVISAFADELDRSTRRKSFRFRNDIVWHAMLDVRDKLVIDLCSLTVEMRHGMKPLDPKAKDEYRGSFKRKRGLFIEIRDHHLASLTRAYVPHPDDDAYEVARSTETRADTFARMFPNCTADSPSAADLENLCERFRVHMIPLRNDRNKNRAHALEGDARLARMLWVPEVAGLFAYLEELLEDLSLVSSGNAFGRSNLNHASCEETAADMVDLILFGNISNVRRLTAKGGRDQLYSLLHEIHDASTATEAGDARELYFNDCQFGPPFED
jgi:hypothetical protein